MGVKTIDVGNKIDATTPLDETALRVNVIELGGVDDNDRVPIRIDSEERDDENTLVDVRLNDSALQQRVFVVTALSITSESDIMVPVTDTVAQ